MNGFKRIFLLLALSLGLAACQAGGPVGAGNRSAFSPTGIPMAGETPSPIAPNAAAGGGTDVMAPISDHSDSTEDETSAKLTDIQKGYPTLALPGNIRAVSGPQTPNSQSPVQGPQPQPEWKDDCWHYSLTLTVQAHYPTSGGGEIRREDFKRGPFVRVVTMDRSTLPNSEPDWSTANYWDKPLLLEEKDGRVSNVKLELIRPTDTDVMLFLYYRPPQDASSATDFAPSPFPDTVDCDPSAMLCELRGFQSADTWESFKKDPNVIAIGRYLMDVDETRLCIIRSFNRIQPAPGSPSTTPETQGDMLRVLDNEDDEKPPLIEWVRPPDIRIVR